VSHPANLGSNEIIRVRYRKGGLSQPSLEFSMLYCKARYRTEGGATARLPNVRVGRCCSLIPGLGVKLSTIILAGPTVLSAVGACPPHDGVRRRWRINVESAVALLGARKVSNDLTTATVPAGMRHGRRFSKPLRSLSTWAVALRRSMVPTRRGPMISSLKMNRKDAIPNLSP
jgi:hypothetical protein